MWPWPGLCGVEKIDGFEVPAVLASWFHAKRRKLAGDVTRSDVMPASSRLASLEQVVGEEGDGGSYLQAFRASHRFTPGTNLRAWLRTILTNLVRNHHRDRDRSRVRSNEAEVERASVSQVSRQASPEQLLLNKVIGPRLQVALESMPKALRDAVWLRDVEELSYVEMAHQLRVPLGTVMSRISRGRRLLPERLLALDGCGLGSEGGRR